MSKTPKIEKGVPIPAIGSRRKGCGVTGVMRLMKVGDSFRVQTSRQSARAMAVCAGIRITIRQESESVIRVWRIAGEKQLRAEGVK